MKCKYCGIENESDAIYCKKCGLSLLEEKKYIDNKREKTKKDKVKTKTKTKTKIKKVKQKPKRNKEKTNNSKTVERRMSFGQKLLMFLMFIIIIALFAVCAVAGYYYYQEQNITVPNVVGLTYQQAELKLAENDLKAGKEEKEIDDESEEGKVISQSRLSGSKTHKNAKIKVVVGVLKTYTLPNFVGVDLDKVKNILNHNNIKYVIKIKEVEDGQDNIVISQNPKASSKITIDETVNLVVSKIKEVEKDTTTTKDTEKTDTNTSTDEENE